jgi:hypothetical protein
VAGDPGAASTSIPPLRDEPPPTRSAELSGVVANLTTRTRVDRPGSGRGEAASQAALSRAVTTAGRGRVRFGTSRLRTEKVDLRHYGGREASGCSSYPTAHHLAKAQLQTISECCAHMGR